MNRYTADHAKRYVDKVQAQHRRGEAPPGLVDPAKVDWSGVGARWAVPLMPIHQKSVGTEESCDRAKALRAPCNIVVYWRYPSVRSGIANEDEDR